MDDPVGHVWDLMAAQRMWLLPVLDGRRLVGVIHYVAVTGSTNSPSRGPGPPPRPFRTVTPDAIPEA